eukprot:1051003-Pyramimonas_sp.AAC.1
MEEKPLEGKPAVEPIPNFPVSGMFPENIRGENSSKSPVVEWLNKGLTFVWSPCLQRAVRPAGDGLRCEHLAGDGGGARTARSGDAVLEVPPTLQVAYSQGREFTSQGREFTSQGREFTSRSRARTPNCVQ